MGPNLNLPLVTIIMPCYNQAEYINDALTSLLNQTYQNWECIIVNDGSTDNIDELIKIWLKDDIRIRYFKQENQGVCITKNNAVKYALGQYILPLDADDTINPKYLELCIQNFSNDDMIVYCKSTKFGVVNEKWDLDEFEVMSFLASNCIPNTAMFKKDDFDLVCGYDINMKFGFEDWELWISFVHKINKNIKLIDYYGYNYRIKEISRNTEMREISSRKIFTFNNIFNKHKELYDRYYYSNLFLIQDIYHKKKINKLYKSKLLKFYNNPLTKLYFKIQKFIS